MADNITLDPGTGGATVAGDDIGGVIYPRGKLSLGADGSATDAVGGAGVVSAAVQRVTLASDDPAVTALQIIDNIVLAEDAAHVSGDPGVQLLAVRKDSGAAIAGTDGDYSPLQVDASGALRVTGGGGGTEYTEDAAAAADPVGGMMMTVRADSLAAVTSTDGDNIALRATNKGELYVKQSDAVPVTDNSGSLTVDNAGTFATQVDGAALTALQLIDDPVGTDGSAVPAKAFAVGGTDGTNLQTLKTDASGELQVDVLTLPALAAGSNKIGGVDTDADATPGSAVPSTALYVAGTDGTNARGLKTDTSGELQVDVVGALPAGTNNIGDVDVLSVPAPLSTTGGGTEATALRVTVASDSTGVLSVDDNGSTLSVDDGGASLTVDGTVTASNAAGDVAHDGVDSGNPVKIGAQARSSQPTAVANADRSNLTCTLTGELLVEDAHCPEDTLNGTTSAMTGTTSTQVIAAQAAGVRIYVTDLIVTNSHATVGTFVTIRDGDGGTILWEGYAAAAGGGFAHSFRKPLRGTAATRLDAKCETTGANVIVSVNGYKGA